MFTTTTDYLESLAAVDAEDGPAPPGHNHWLESVPPFAVEGSARRLPMEIQVQHHPPTKRPCVRLHPPPPTKP
eukprot:7140107-Prorocentrum_lima.AAC.1